VINTSRPIKVGWKDVNPNTCDEAILSDSLSDLYKKQHRKGYYYKEFESIKENYLKKLDSLIPLAKTMNEYYDDWPIGDPRSDAFFNYDYEASKLGITHFPTPKRLDDSSSIMRIKYFKCPLPKVIKSKWRVKHLPRQYYDTFITGYIRGDINYRIDDGAYDLKYPNLGFGLKMPPAYLGLGAGFPETAYIELGLRKVFYRGTEIRIGGMAVFREKMGYERISGSFQIYPYYSNWFLRQHKLRKHILPIYFGLKYDDKKIFLNVGTGLL
jgi:hypothetical protein